MQDREERKERKERKEKERKERKTERQATVDDAPRPTKMPRHKKKERKERKTEKAQATVHTPPAAPGNRDPRTVIPRLKLMSDKDQEAVIRWVKNTPELWDSKNCKFQGWFLRLHENCLRDRKSSKQQQLQQQQPRQQQLQDPLPPLKVSKVSDRYIISREPTPLPLTEIQNLSRSIFEDPAH